MSTKNNIPIVIEAYFSSFLNMFYSNDITTKIIQDIAR